MRIGGPVSADLKLDESAKFGTAAREAAHYMLRLRKAAKTCFGAPLPSEAAWNVMLALYTAESRHNGLHIASISRLADVPRTTALRALLKLQDGGFVTLAPDTRDKRAVHVSMTEEGMEAMQRCFTAARFIA